MEKTVPIILILLCLTLLSCSSINEQTISSVISPDGKSIAFIILKEKRGLAIPPEPAPTLGRWARLYIKKEGRIISDTGFEKICDYMRYSNLDLVWSPNSSQIAIKKVGKIIVIDEHGNKSTKKIIKNNSIISSFKWLTNKELLVLVKGIDGPLTTCEPFGTMHFHGFSKKINKIRILRFNKILGTTDRFTQDVNMICCDYTNFGLQKFEISPYSSHVAFRDGKKLNIYDDSVGKIISQISFDGSIEGFWWEDANNVIIGLDLSSERKKRFLSFNISQNKITDKTFTLKHLWNPIKPDREWFRLANFEAEFD